MFKKMISFAAVAGMVLALAPAAQAAINDFSTDPNIAGDWVVHAFEGTASGNLAVWNSVEEDLDLSSDGTGFSAIRYSGALRGPTDTVSLEIKQNRPTEDVTFGTKRSSLVGLMISSTPTPTKNDTNPRYTFWYEGHNTNRWFQVYRDGGNWLWNVYYAQRDWGIKGPIVLDIKRNGGNYEFWINNSKPTTAPVYTGSYYTPEQHDSMVYYHILWGANATAGAMAATVDNFTMPENVAPIADADGPYDVPYGGTLNLDGSGSFDDSGIISYDWDIGSGALSVNTASAMDSSITWQDLVDAGLSAGGAIDLTVTDDGTPGLTDSDGTTFTVGAAPSVIPEPSTCLIWSLGLLGLIGFGLRRKR